MLRRLLKSPCPFSTSWMTTVFAGLGPIFAVIFAVSFSTHLSNLSGSCPGPTRWKTNLWRNQSWHLSCRLYRLNPDACPFRGPCTSGNIFRIVMCVLRFDLDTTMEPLEQAAMRSSVPLHLLRYAEFASLSREDSRPKYDSRSDTSENFGSDIELTSFRCWAEFEHTLSHCHHCVDTHAHIHAMKFSALRDVCSN